jgi:hypothetical protein
MPAKNDVTIYRSSIGLQTTGKFGTPPQSVVVQFTDTVTDTRSAGTSNRGWKELIRKGQAATSSLNGIRYAFKIVGGPMSGKIEGESQVQENGQTVWKPWTTTWQGYPSILRRFAPSGVGTDYSTANAIAIKKFYRQVKACQQHFDGLTFLGELRETLHMLRHPAQSLFRSAREDYLHAVARRARRGGNWRRGLSGAWLEWSFGVQPLVNDIKSALDTLDFLREDLIKSKGIRAVGVDFKDGGFTEFLDGPGMNIWFTGVRVKSIQHKVKYNAKYLVKRDWPAPTDLASRLALEAGLNFRNFIPTAWELMPWSFLMDYFANIGDVLEQACVDTQNVAWCVKTSVQEVQDHWTCALDSVRTTQQNTFATIPGPGSRVTAIDPGVQSHLYAKRVSFSRTAAFPGVDTLRFEWPGFSTKWLNMAALLGQAGGIHPQRFRR